MRLEWCEAKSWCIFTMRLIKTCVTTKYNSRVKNLCLSRFKEHDKENKRWLSPIEGFLCFLTGCLGIEARDRAQIPKTEEKPRKFVVFYHEWHFCWSFLGSKSGQIERQKFQHRCKKYGLFYLATYFSFTTAWTAVRVKCHFSYKG